MGSEVDIISNVTSIEKCYGCGVCTVACPTGIIELSEKDGFYRPLIKDNEKCLRCSLCLKNCSFISGACNSKAPEMCFVAWSKDKGIRRTSTSGGIIYELLKHFVSKGSNAIVVRYNYSTNRAEHYIASNISQLEDSIGSKYIPSNFANALRLINNKDKYVVVGTPCQIASLKNYVNSKHIEKNFIFIDFFCHGVPSLKFWDKYLAGIKKKTGKVRFIRFRNKYIDNITSSDFKSYKQELNCSGESEFDWSSSTNLFIYGTKGYYNSRLALNDSFYRFFLGNRCLNDCCYDSCVFKQMSSFADIRVGDIWGKTFSKNRQGASSVICFTKNGINVINSIKDRLHIKMIPYKIASEGQMCNNAKRAVSYKYVKKALNGNKNLNTIDHYASLIEFCKAPKKVTKRYLKITLKFLHLYS